METDRIADYSFVKVEPKLNYVWLELTQKCNFKCVHCYEGNTHQEPNNPLTYAEWKKVICDCVENGCCSIQFIGGEPSIHPLLPALMYHARNVGIRDISIFSNLYNISEELFESIQECGATVKFSIYGTSASSHDSVTQRYGSFDKLMASIRKFQAHKIPLSANVVLMKENEAEKASIREFLEKHGIRKVNIDEIRKVYGGSQNQHMLRSPTVLYTKPNFRANRNVFNSNYYTNSCWYGKITISTDGTVYPCEFERNIVYGNLRIESLKEILSGKILNKYWYLPFHEIHQCRYCEYRFACKDCRPLAFAEHGCIYEQNPRCCYNPATGNWKIVKDTD